MANIFYRVKYSSTVPADIAATGFTISLQAGYTAAPAGVKGYFVIVDSTDTSIFMNVIGTVTGSVLAIDRVEYDSTKTNGVVDIANATPTFTVSGAVSILSSLPLEQYSEKSAQGKDAILIMGDQNAIGYNGSVGGYGTAGWNLVIDTPDTNVLMYQINARNINADHTATANDEIGLTGELRPAEDPFPYAETSFGMGPVNGVGFGLTFAKSFYHRAPGKRQTVILPYAEDGKLVAGYSGPAESGVNYVTGFTLAYDGSEIGAIVISLGMEDAIAGTASATFQTAFDAIITDHRANHPSVPVIVCSMPTAIISSIGGTASAINDVLVDTPNRLPCVAVAVPGSYTLDSTTRFVDGPGQRLFGDVIYSAYQAALDNQTL